jgi:hypothetical protein
MDDLARTVPAMGKANADGPAQGQGMQNHVEKARREKADQIKLPPKGIQLQKWQK